MKIIRSSDVVIEFVLDLIMKREVKPGDKLPSTENLVRKIDTSFIQAETLLGIRRLQTMNLGRRVYEKKQRHL